MIRYYLVIFFRILRVLDILENIYEFIPEPPLSPILMKKLQGKRKLRVKKSKVMEKKLGAEKKLCKNGLILLFQSLKEL